MASNASLLLFTARRIAGLTQRDLARRARTSQSVIARIESDTTSPTWETLEQLLGHAGLELRVALKPRPPAGSQLHGDVARILQLTPERRLEELREAARLLDFPGASAVDGDRILPRTSGMP